MSIKVEGLSFSYGAHQVLHDIGFEVPDATLTVVLGPNGVGKTTLFRCILGLAAGYDGTIEVNGKDVARLSVAQRARELAYIPQAHANIFDYEVVDLVLMACGTDLGMMRSPTRRHEARAMEALERAGIAELAHRPITQLSGGQQQLALVARAIAQDSRAIVMDEPTSALDFANTSRVLGLVRELSAEGRSVLLSMHQPDQAYLYADRVLAMQDGGVYAQGLPADVVTQERVSELYGVDVRVCPLFGDQARAVVPASALADGGRKQEAAPRGERG